MAVDRHFVPFYKVERLGLKGKSIPPSLKDVSDQYV